MVLKAIGDFLAGDADEAAEEAGRIQAGFAQQQGALAREFTAQALSNITDAEKAAIDALTTAQKQALAERAKAGEALSDAEQRALAVLESSGDEAVNAITGGLGTINQFADVGTQANQEIAALNGLLGPEAQQEAFARFRTSPAFEFRRTEGLRALDDSAAARGGLLSGNTLEEITRFGQGLASEEFNASVGRLNVLADRGLTAGGTQANAGAQIGNVLATRGAQASDVITGTGVNQANILAGSGDIINQGGVNRANIITGSAQDRVRALLSGTELETGALSSEGNAQAAGLIGGANARAQGIQSLFTGIGTVAGAAAGNPSNVLFSRAASAAPTLAG